MLQTGRSKGAKEKQTTLQWQLGIMAWKWNFNKKDLTDYFVFDIMPLNFGQFKLKLWR